MESTTQLSSEDKSALCQLEQKASNLRQSSSNNFLVSLEGLMLSAIAWESIGKESKYKWISPLSKATTAIGLAVTGIFGALAVADRTKAARVDAKLKKYGVDELTLPCEMKQPAAPAPAPIPMAHSALHAGHAHHPHQQHHAAPHHQQHPHMQAGTMIQGGANEVSRLHDTAQQQVG